MVRGFFEQPNDRTFLDNRQRPHRAGGAAPDLQWDHDQEKLGCPGSGQLLQVHHLEQVHALFHEAVDVDRHRVSG